MAKVFQSDFFNFEFVRALHAAPFEAAEIGECFEAAADIKNGDPESWYAAWQTAAEKSAALAEEARAVNDREAERWCLLRTWNYLRASESLLHINSSDPRLLSVSEKAVEYFHRGISLLDSKVLHLEIPFEDYKLPAYLYLPANNCRITGKTPIIVHTAGFDSSQEELYLFVAAGARTRGYAVLTFEGPGQGLVLRKHGKTMRPDWEVVTSKVIDFVYDLVKESPDLNLDLDRLALTGNSMGGYFVLRGATDPRVKACISTDGFYDVWLFTESRLPKWLVTGWESGWLKDWFINGVINAGAKLNFQLAWEFYHSMWVYGVKSPADVLREFKNTLCAFQVEENTWVMSDAPSW
ncbi:putative alpha beta hydrolase protein [Botrytis fragariae]|uniref:Putative alpha beta hydrolase protein n=1 Tax=Botrytis fragariae TaxID=1964551 RepID=A0A8H6EN94_9HELO|nr:putative alpha beta hydrolase protein [Botrytis fragariae]KAF5878448.1 putative alpha beta hydrolase protein [Botrytis fragariae]